MKIKEYFQHKFYFVIGLIFGLILGIYWLLDMLITKIRQFRFERSVKSMSLVLLRQKLIDEEKTKTWKNI
jgi:hypothetical protein